MEIPFLDLKAQYQSLKEEIDQKISEVISSQNFILGAEVKGLEKEIASYCGAKFGVGVSSGSDALLVSLMALGIGEADEVVTTPFTFFATAGSIARLKAKPVFCDIDEKSYNLSLTSLEEVLEHRFKKRDRKVKALMPVHLYGQCAEMDAILSLQKKYNLLVIEDAAQAVGAEYPGADGAKRAGTMGNLGALSFFPSKNLGAFGDGGMVLTNDQSLAQKVKMLRVHGSRDKYFYDILGGNFRLDAIQAAILRVKLRHLEGWQQRRQERASYYDRLFEESGLAEQGLIQTPEPLYRKSGVKNYHIYHQYVLKAKKRDELQKFLKEKGIGTAVYYPLPLHLQKCFAFLDYREGDFPVSEKTAREVLALPIYPELAEAQQDFILSSIVQFYKS